jgi:hypothetical protein
VRAYNSARARLAPESSKDEETIGRSDVVSVRASSAVPFQLASLAQPFASKAASSKGRKRSRSSARRRVSNCSAARRSLSASTSSPRLGRALASASDAPATWKR